MPPRLMTAAIILFWLGMTGWLIQREVVPMMLAETSSTYQVDLTDEIGSPQVHWTVWMVSHTQGKEIKEHVGDGDSKIHANDDRTYEFRSALRFKDGKMSLFVGHLRRLESVYRVTEEGKLLSFSSKAGIVLGGFQDHVLEGEIRGNVADNVLEPQLIFGPHIEKLDKVELPKHGSIVNPMHPLNRLRGLHTGQIWKITLIDPLRSTRLVDGIAKHAIQAVTIPSLIAEVKTDTLVWDRKEVDCYKIEYYEPGKDVTARTWVRKIDGLVLQQEAKMLFFELVSQRRPD